MENKNDINKSAFEVEFSKKYDFKDYVNKLINIYQIALHEK